MARRTRAHSTHALRPAARVARAPEKAAFFRAIRARPQVLVAGGKRTSHYEKLRWSPYCERGESSRELEKKLPSGVIAFAMRIRCVPKTRPSSPRRDRAFVRKRRAK